MLTRILFAPFALFFLAACSSTPPAPAAPGQPAVAQGPAASKPATDPKVAEEQKQKAEARKAKQKDLRNKQRELEYARIEQRTAELDRSVRQMTVAAALQRTAAELEAARKNLEHFLAATRLRELEEKKIQLDYSTYAAEHSKDELGELEAMYQADEFAKQTKELVLKRGRREMELTERRLAVASKENAEYEKHTLPERERELRQKVTDTELERKKAEVEAEKAGIELQIAERKGKERLADLAEEIADLQEWLAKEPS